MASAQTEPLVAPNPAPPLNIPECDVTVKVSCIDSTARLKLPMQQFLRPNYAGKDHLVGPAFSFLIEHPTQKAVLFDLGVRKDFDKLPSFPKFKEMGWEISVDKDVATILKENGVDVDGGAIGSIIWSHHHWDHVGDASTFPASTEVVVGPGFEEHHLPGYPQNPDSTLLDSDIRGRTLREVSFPESSPVFGRFKAHDFFGDGSFYLLYTIGHTAEHICGLARTSKDPDTFIFCGGDACHHSGEMRPTPHLPLPKSLDPSPAPRVHAAPCPGELLAGIHPHRHKNATSPFYYVTPQLSYDKELADWSIAGLGEFDGQPDENVLIVLAHDQSMMDPPQFPLYPESMNEWHKQGVGQKVRWRFLEDFASAVEEKSKGSQPCDWGDTGVMGAD
ncbi:hypothetical protein MBLNU230_g8203t1 [Neophaeotheca triangularis]